MDRSESKSQPPAEFPVGAQLHAWDRTKHAPCIGLINPKSGGRRGESILAVCRNTEYFRERIFSALEVIDGTALDDFRDRLDEAKEAARASGDPNCRPRLVCGGGDGTASLALYLVFRALLRGFESEVDWEDSTDDANRSFFAWTDEDMRRFFPALVQMPLGTGNDLAGVLGWGRRAPSDQVGLASCYRDPERALEQLARWFDEAISLTTPVMDFDVWGFMPPEGEEELSLKLCEVERIEQKRASKSYVMKPPGPAVPFLMLLYGCFGFSAHVVARFELVRTHSRWLNFLAYSRVAGSLLLQLGPQPRQLLPNLEGLVADVLPAVPSTDEHYMPPRPTHKSRRYHEVGFLNLWSTRGGLVRGIERASFQSRWCGGCGAGNGKPRRAADFGDGRLDFYRERGLFTWMKTGTNLQTDRGTRGTFSFAAAAGKGIFFQFDGEGRFAFHPEGKAWRADVRRVLVVPVAVHPSARPGPAPPGGFSFVGSPDEIEFVRARICKWVMGDLVEELNATAEEIELAGFPLAREAAEQKPPSRPEIRSRMRPRRSRKRKTSVADLWAADSMCLTTPPAGMMRRIISDPLRQPPTPQPTATRAFTVQPTASLSLLESVAEEELPAAVRCPQSDAAREGTRKRIGFLLIGQCCALLCRGKS